MSLLNEKKHWLYANRYRGEIVANINNKNHALRLTLNALARLESCYRNKDILSLIRRFAKHGIEKQDAENIIRAALGEKESVDVIETKNPIALAQALLERAFNNQL